MCKITVTLINWYSCDDIKQLIENLRQKAADPDSFGFLIIDNTNGTDDALQQLTTELHKHIEIHPFSPDGLKSSLAHAAGLNQAMGLLNSPYTLVCDPDIYVFKENWDAFLPELLISHDAIAAGAPYPDWKTGKYHDFPSPPFCFFKTQAIRDLCEDWFPYAGTRLGSIWTFLIRQIGRMGLVISRDTYQKYETLRQYSRWAENTLGVFAPDTGWKIARAAKQSHAGSIVFDTMMPESSVLKELQSSETWIELARHYELFFFDGYPFLVHKYGTQGLLWKTGRGNDDAYWKGYIQAAEKDLMKESDR